MKRYINIALIVGIILFLYSFVNFSLNQLWDWISTVSIVLGILIGGVAIYYKMQTREKKMGSHFLKFGANALLSSLITLGIIVLVAFITNRHSTRADLTAKGLYSLAEQTKSILNTLDKEVKIYAFYKKTDELSVKDLLEEYAHRSSNIKFEFIDPNQKPQIARRYNVTQYNTIVVESGVKRETITEFSESNLTNAIMKVTRDLDKVIYFLKGHGERDAEADTPQGYKTAWEGIKKENYMVQTLNLAEKKSIPEDCSVLIIAGPKSDFFEFELDTIQEYINTGGKLMAMIDPQVQSNFINFLQNYKVSLKDNIVVDASGVGQLFGMGPEIPLVTDYEDHDIFKEFSTMTFFPSVRSVETTTEGETSITTKVLFKSTPSGWAEADYQNREVGFNNERDIKGPVPLAVVSTKDVDQNKKAQVLIIGDSDFASNAYIRNSGNNDLFLNMLNWLAEEEDMITIRPKEIDDRRVNLTQKDSKLILYLCVIALPLLIVIGGVVVYFKRR